MNSQFKFPPNSALKRAGPSVRSGGLLNRRHLWRPPPRHPSSAGYILTVVFPSRLVRGFVSSSPLSKWSVLHIFGRTCHAHFGWPKMPFWPHLLTFWLATMCSQSSQLTLWCTYPVGVPQRQLGLPEQRRAPIFVHNTLVRLQNSLWLFDATLARLRIALTLVPLLACHNVGPFQ
jgi:hypothetical protein